MKFKEISKTKSVIYSIICLLVIVAAGAIVFWGLPGVKIGNTDFGGRGSAKNITQGLDLKGGTSITYQVESGASREEISDTRNKLEKRVQSKFSSEATAYTEGEDRITVEIPGAYDADAAIDELGKPGKMYFCTLASDTPTEEQLENEEYIQLGESYYQVWLTGNDIADAQGTSQQDEKTKALDYVVSLTFTDKGAKEFDDMAGRRFGDILIKHRTDIHKCECLSNYYTMKTLSDFTTVMLNHK